MDEDEATRTVPQAAPRRGGAGGGRLVAVVGPSGAGKDTLIAGAVAARPDLVWARRTVTRPEAAGGEPCESVSRSEFLRRRDAGGFAIWWTAHGLLYGVPASIRADLEAGRTVIFNGSRAALDEARRRFPGLAVIHVTAPRATLAERLALRAREDAGEIAARLERADAPAPADARVVVNDAAPEDGVRRFLAALSPPARSA